jgi:hypothetical protein
MNSSGNQQHQQQEEQQFSLFSIPPMNSTVELALPPANDMLEIPENDDDDDKNNNNSRRQRLPSLQIIEPTLYNNDNNVRVDNRRRKVNATNSDEMTAFAVKKQALLNLQNNVLELIELNENMVRKQQRLEQELSKLKVGKSGK